MRVDKNFFSGLILGICLGIVAGVIAMVMKSRTQPAPIIIMPPEPTMTPLPTATAAPLRVFVSGAVMNPDVYQLEPGSVAGVAIEAAGGFTAEADRRHVNLAQPLADGLHIHIPSEDEIVVHSSNSGAAIVSGVTDSQLPVGAAGGLININTASLAELNSLPGIGPGLAQAIIDYREANGPFADIADITQVSGIGESRLEQIKGLITID